MIWVQRKMRASLLRRAMSSTSGQYVVAHKLNLKGTF
jgi:hypothetical protein